MGPFSVIRCYNFNFDIDASRNLPAWWLYISSQDDIFEKPEDKHGMKFVK